MVALSLQNLPVEVLVNIFSHLDEADFKSLEQTNSLFNRIVHDEELWKTLFLQRNNTLWFPSFSRSPLYSVEYVERNKGLNQWRHNRATKTKYNITHDPTQPSADISNVVFDFPRCACYNDGMVTFLQLHSKRRKDRVAYIPCTTPHGTSTRHFNINAVVFGRYDGRVFGKLLTNKSYLSPVTEFDSKHNNAVTAIITTAYEESSDDWCVSGDESGLVVWWCNTKKQAQLQISHHPIAQFFVHKTITIAIDLESVIVIESMKKTHSIDLQKTIGDDFSKVKFSKMDFGGRNVILATLFHVYVISVDITRDFGSAKVIQFNNIIQELSLDEMTAKKNRNANLPGGDSCFVSVLTEDSTVYTINVRSPRSELKAQTKLSFHDNPITCQINNLVLVCAFSGMIGIYDVITGGEIRVIQNSEIFPEFLYISHGQLLVGKGNTLYYYQYIAEAEYLKKKKNSSRNRSNKWNENLKAQLTIYDSEEELRKNQQKQDELLKKKFVGDIDDDDIQLQIALMESTESSKDAKMLDHYSKQTYQGDVSPDEKSSIGFIPEDDIDEQFLQAIRESKLEEQAILKRKKTAKSTQLGQLDHIHGPEHISDAESLDEETKKQIEIMEQYSSDIKVKQDEDEDMALAIALSLSQMDGETKQ